ncbi:hypothetical protein BU26DRAFT_554809 [Trematosphaeria pertusa]|uniref:RING-type domain-containing protein n=1 Tax=Trematosphaeria pertusa TaxID=390896 RepID=A0A6A6HZD7_9PLEO|nr:uncharacterized protein BU26DRAFT_554809 [Trematosphaeria pertusa]KAF2243269.1 hypothetical protein BU26DRAFT_554809 [Trematosphaeria pertusa]
MENNTALPSKNEYLANQIDVISDCSICHEGFDDEHRPARLSGQNSCHHVFGSTCLRRWLESDEPAANKCPMCRKILYHQNEGEERGDEEEGEDEEDEDEDMESVGTSDDQGSEQEDEEDRTRSSRDPRSIPQSGPPRGPIFCLGYSNEYWKDALQQLPHKYDAKELTKLIWETVWDTAELDYIFEDDVEIAIHHALRNRHIRRDSRRIVHLWSIIWFQQWPGVLEVARDMIRAHYRNREFVDLGEEELDDWVQKMSQALDWQTCDENNCQLDGAPCAGHWGDGP